MSDEEMKHQPDRQCCDDCDKALVDNDQNSGAGENQ